MLPVKPVSISSTGRASAIRMDAEMMSDTHGRATTKRVNPPQKPE